MLRFIYTLSFLALLLGFSSCDGGAKADLATSSDQNITAEEPAVEAGVPAPVEQAVPMQGEQYEIVVLNDSIKSPRKELRATVDGIDVVVNYGSPSVNGREIWGGLVPFGKVSRTGANEAVRLTISDPMMMGNETIPAGTYSLFTLPEDKENWYYIVNKVADQWGSYDYDAAQDVARMKTKSLPSDTFSERMDFAVYEDELQLHWGDLIVPISLKKAGK